MAKPFAAFDIDGTLIRWQLFHATADALVKAGKIDREQYRAIKDARMSWKKRMHAESFREYEERLVKIYQALMNSLAVSDVHAAMDAVFEEYKDQVYTYTRNLIRDLKEQGYLLFAISGTQTELVEKLCQYYGFDDWVGSTYEYANDRYTGKMTLALGRKHEVLQELIAKHRATIKGSIAVGDSTGDISMLEMAERPIAFNPEQKLLNHARTEGWEVVVERKNVVYELKAKDGIYLLA
jgi:HAD superfamily hydrolase (TIGR01490 family)